MGMAMKQTKMNVLAAALAKDLKTAEGLNALSAQRSKITVEAALKAEMESHLGYAPHDTSGNSRNGYSSKILKGHYGEVVIDTPRDREATCEPSLISKGQIRITGMDDQVLSLYAKGMSTRDIVDAFQEMYAAAVSAGLISKVTNAVMEQVLEWQNRPLDAVYPIVYLDCIVLKIRQDKRVINKSIYLALGANLEGHKELLGQWMDDPASFSGMAETEGAKFWLQVLTELKYRGIEQVLTAVLMALPSPPKGTSSLMLRAPDVVNTAFTDARFQLCIIYMVCNALKYVPWKDCKAVTADLKCIYQSTTEQEASLELDHFAETCGHKYPQISKSWWAHWANLIALFDFPADIRKEIYATNAIESVSSVTRNQLKHGNCFRAMTLRPKLSTWLYRLCSSAHGHPLHVF